VHNIKDEELAMKCPKCFGELDTGMNCYSCQSTGAISKSAPAPGLSDAASIIEQERKEWEKKGKDYLNEGNYADGIGCVSKAMGLERALEIIKQEGT
jgi:hypothetical protein